MGYNKILVSVVFGNLHYYTDLPVEKDDQVLLETRDGTIKGTVCNVTPIDCNPFEPNNKGYSAKKHVLENVTKKIMKDGIDMYTNCKVVEIKHSSSDRTVLAATYFDVREGDIVVYERPGKNNFKGFPVKDMTFSVGVVVNTDTDVFSAPQAIVDIVHVGDYLDRLERIKRAQKLKKQLEAKKKMFEEQELLLLIAAKDPDTKKLLDEYNELLK